MKAKYKMAIFLAGLCVLAGCGPQEGQNQSTVAVSGTGIVFAQPDMAQMSVSVSHIAPTTRQAREVVNTGVRQILDILKEAGVEDRNIQSASLRFQPEYQWRNGQNVFIGHKAEQGISLCVEDIKTSPEKVPGIIDKIALVDKARLHSVDFDVKDKTALFVQARELAWTKATDKARHYAQLSGLKMGKVISISEEGGNPWRPTATNVLLSQSAMMRDQSLPEAATTTLPTGELQITAQVALLVLLE